MRQDWVLQWARGQQAPAPGHAERLAPERGNLNRSPGAYACFCVKARPDRGRRLDEGRGLAQVLMVKGRKPAVILRANHHLSTGPVFAPHVTVRG
jgi:hypothetical protein